MPEEQVSQEQQASDLAALRAEVSGEVFGDSEQLPDHTRETQEQTAEQPEKPEEVVDPWAGISTALRDQFTALSAKVKEFDAKELRLKQAEQRIGSLTNEIHAAKQAAENIARIPTAEEIADAAKSKAAEDDLKREFPEWYAAIDGKIAAESAKLRQSIPDIAALKQELEGRTGQAESALLARIANAELKLELTRLSVKHPDFPKIKESTEYAQWLGSQPDTVKSLASSMEADDAINLLNSYKDSPVYKTWAGIKPQKSASEIAAERQQRLQRSQTIPAGRNIQPPRSEADMTLAEIRAQEAAKVWKKG